MVATRVAALRPLVERIAEFSVRIRQAGPDLPHGRIVTSLPRAGRKSAALTCFADTFHNASPWAPDNLCRRRARG
jgi:hypothetical protein